MKIAFAALFMIIGLVASSFIAFASGGINGGNPVPYIQFDESSARFLSVILKKDYGGTERGWSPYAWGLAKTLSQLNGSEQNELWYGSGGGTDPGGADPGGTDPGGTDPGGTDPGGTDPGGTDPGGTDPGSTDPGSTDPGGTDPGGTDPGGTDPGSTDPGGELHTGIRTQMQDIFDRREANGMPRGGENFVNNLINQGLLPLSLDEWDALYALPEQPSPEHLLRLQLADFAAGGTGGS